MSAMQSDPNVLEDGNVKVEWMELGEGLDGDYDPENPDDVELLRFDVYVQKNKWGDWEAPPDSSYCTRVPVSSTPEERAKLLKLIMDRVYQAVQLGHNISKVCERLSWISLDWIK